MSIVACIRNEKIRRTSGSEGGSGCITTSHPGMKLGVQYLPVLGWGSDVIREDRSGLR